MVERRTRDTVAWVEQNFLSFERSAPFPLEAPRLADLPSADPADLIVEGPEDRVYLPSFSCHWAWMVPDGEASVRYRTGPTQASLEEALDWARAAANRVFVTLSDGQYSAGSTRIRREREWPPASLERMPGLGASSTTDLGPLQHWRADYSFHPDADDYPLAAPRFEEALTRDSRIVVVSAGDDDPAGCLAAEFAFHSPNLQLAGELATGTFLAAVTALDCGLANPLNGRYTSTVTLIPD